MDDRTIITKRLRLLPFAAGITPLMVFLSFLNTVAPWDSYTYSIVYWFTAIIGVICCFFFLYCLQGIVNLSYMFKRSMNCFILTICSFCLFMLTSTVQYNYIMMDNYDIALILGNIIVVLTVLNKMLFLFAAMFLLKAFKEVLEKIGNETLAAKSNFYAKAILGLIVLDLAELLVYELLDIEPGIIEGSLLGCISLVLAVLAASFVYKGSFALWRSLTEIQK